MKDKISAPRTLNSTDYRKLLRDIAYFGLVPLSFYLISLITTLNEAGHIISWADFIPTNATVIAIVTWLANQILNLIRKFIQ